MEGEWATGIIAISEGMQYGTAFILPYDGIVKNIYVLFSSSYTLLFEEGSTIHPFICLAVSTSDDLVYTILQDTLTYTDVYIGGVEYPTHTIRKGSLTNLNIDIAEGTLVAIVAGIIGDNVTTEQYGNFSISGGIFLE